LSQFRGQLHEATKEFIRSQIKDILDYINWAGSFPNQVEVTRALKSILDLVPPPKDRNEAN
jgi:hypothetical protein